MSLRSYGKFAAVFAVGVLWTLSFLPTSGAAESRIWTDASGKHKTTATFVSRDGTTVRLRRSDGKTIIMQMEKLSAQDQEYIESLDSNPFEEGVVEDENAAPAATSGAFPISGKTQKFDGWDKPIFLGDRTREKSLSIASATSEWKYSPVVAEPKPLKDFRSVPVFKGGSIDVAAMHDLRVIAPPKDRPEGAFFVGFRTGVLNTAQSYIARCDVSEGVGELSELAVKEARLCDVSPDGAWGLFIVGLNVEPGFPKKSFLAFVDLSAVSRGVTLSPAAIFCPYYEEKSIGTFKNRAFGELENALWVDEEHVITQTRGETTLWNLKTCEAEYTIALAGYAALDPSRKNLVLVSGIAAGFYDALTGAAVGRVAVEKSTGEPVFSQPNCAFSQSGAKLAFSTPQGLAIADLTVGKVERVLRSPTLFKALAWGAENYVIWGQIGFDLETESSLCSYSGLGTEMNSVAGAFGRVWTVAEKTLVGFEAPHQAALDALKQAANPDAYEIYPGVGVAIKTDLNGLLDSKEVVANLEESVKRAGLKVDPKSSIVVTAKCKDTGKTVETTCAEVERTLPLGAPPIPLLGRERLKSAITVDLKIFEEGIEITKSGKTLWKMSAITTGPDNIAKEEGKSVEEQIREANKPESDYFKHAYIPKYVSKSSNGAPVVGAAMTQARITASGVR